MDEATLKPDDTACPAIAWCLNEKITVDGETFGIGCGTDRLEGDHMQRIADELATLLTSAPPP